VTHSRSGLLVPAQDLHILDFDIENRPLSYLGGDFTTGEITAIAASFVGEEDIYVWLLGEDDPADMLEEFRVLYDSADMVTGHYIRKHDLPVLVGALREYKLPALGPKLAQDTKLDLKQAKHQSQSQESLAAMLDIDAPKVHMTQDDWREANRLTRAGLAKTYERVTGDIVQHKQLREKLVELGHLNPPVLWKP